MKVIKRWEPPKLQCGSCFARIEWEEKDLQYVQTLGVFISCPDCDARIDTPMCTVLPPKVYQRAMERRSK